MWDKCYNEKKELLIKNNTLTRRVGCGKQQRETPALAVLKVSLCRAFEN